MAWLHGLAGTAAAPASGKGISRRDIGAGLLLIAVGASAWHFLSGHPFADYRTGVGKTRTVSAPDGSLIELAPETRLSPTFDEKARNVMLYQGEACFQFASAPQPFSVVAGSGETTALGTAFSVRYRDGAADVIVTENPVRVATQASRVLVRAGFGVRYAQNLGPVESVDSDEALSWREGRLVFNGRPLGEVVDALNLWRRGKIVVVGNALAAGPETFLVDTDKVDDIGRQLERALPVQIIKITAFLIFVFSALIWLRLSEITPIPVSRRVKGHVDAATGVLNANVRQTAIATTIAALVVSHMPAIAQQSAPPAGIERAFNLQRQPLRSAVEQFGRQTGISVIGDGVLPKDVQSGAAIGTMLPDKALKLLLAGTGIGYEFTDASTVVLRTDTSSWGPGEGIQLGTISVTGTNPNSTMTLPPVYARGQVATGGQLGLLGNRDVMDTPFNQTSCTSQLIQNQAGAQARRRARQQSFREAERTPRLWHRVEFLVSVPGVANAQTITSFEGDKGPGQAECKSETPPIHCDRAEMDIATSGAQVV